MSSVHSPQQKKRLSYERDHYAKGAKSDKGFRKTWPRKKRKANRAFRHAADTLTRTAPQDPDTDVDFGQARFRRQFWQLQKYSVTPLAFERARSFWRRGLPVPSKMLKRLMALAARRDKRTRADARDLTEANYGA
jgi:hypothetical protein